MFSLMRLHKTIDVKIFSIYGGFLKSVAVAGCFCMIFFILPDVFSKDVVQQAHQSVEPFSEDAQEPERFLDIQLVESKSGIRAWLVQDSSVPVIAMEFAFLDAGAKKDPPEKQGLARLLSNTMDEGAGSLDSQAFQKALRDNSITISFSSGRDHFNGSFKTLTQHRDVAFDLLKLAVNDPVFNQEAIDRMRASNISRVRRSLSAPDWIAARIQNDVIFGDHPYGLNSGGTLTTLEKITRDDLIARHNTLGRNMLVIGVSGDINAEDLEEQLDRVFGTLPEVEKTEEAHFVLRNKGKIFLYEKDIPQTVIAISQSGISRNDPQYYAAKLMNFILGESGFGSRLMEEIREKRGLTYGIYSYIYDYDAVDTLHVSTSTANENVNTMLDLIKAEWRRIQGEKVSAEELADAQSYIIGSLPLSLTSTSSIASILLSMQIDGLPITYLDERAEKFKAVSVDDIQAIARTLLNNDDFTTVLVGRPDGIQGVEKIETLPNAE